MDLLNEFEKKFGKDRMRKDEPMALHTTFKIGGPAKYYIDVQSKEELIKAINLAKKLKTPFLILGGGSNIIVSDKGFDGLIIKNNCRKFEVMRMSGKIRNRKLDVDKALVYAESGVIMNQLVRFTIDNGLSGLEYQLGLPGTIGGAIYMNSNFPKKQAYVGDFLSSAELLTKEGDIKEVDKAYFNFSYDKSILQETGEVILSAIFELKPIEKKVLWERGMEALNYRTETQPKGSSAGCTFRNISIAEALRVPTPEKITSAGYLIDKAGLKGKKIGGAMISDMHANFILNGGNAKSEDVVNLIQLAKDEVFKKFGVHLTLEVKIIGDN